MANLSSFYPQPVIAGDTAGTFTEGNDERVVGALQADELGDGEVTASGSSTARALSDRFGEVFHVDDFGAVGNWNGTTGTDDTVAIQNAINAAVAAGGGVVRFSPNKTYRLTTRNVNTVGQTSVGNHLNIYNGTSSLRICIDGQGAKLYSTAPNPASDAGKSGTDIFYICTLFDTIRFENLTFEKAPHLIIYGGAPSGGIRVNPPPTVEPSKLFSIQNCNFIDCTMPLVVVPFDVVEYLNKLDRLEILDTMIFSPRGSSHTLNGFGNQTVNLSRWVNNFICHNVFFNGSPESGILPFDVDAPRDGFSYQGATHEIYSNCYFTGNHVETIIPTSADSASTSVVLQSYVQPDYENQVIWTITTNENNDELAVGDVYIVIVGGVSPVDPTTNHHGIGPAGVYRIDSFTGSFSGQAGQTVTVTRLQESESEIDPKAIPITAGLTVSTTNPIRFGVKVYKREFAANRSCIIENCKFIYDKSIETYPFDVTGDESTDTFTAKGPNGGSCTISNANPAVVTKNNHGLLEGTKVFFTTTGSLPSGVVANTIYHVRDVAENTFTLCALNSLNTRIATTTSGSGVHTMNTAPLIWQAQKVRFKNIVGGTNLVEGKTYYVINKTPTSPLFQVSLTRTGSAVGISTNLTAGNVSSFWRGGDPAITGRCPSTVTGNFFYGCQLAMFFQDIFNWGPTRGSTVTGNTFVVYSDEPDQTQSGYYVANIITDSCIISNNQIVLSKSKDTVYLMFIGANNCSIVGNVVTCLNTASVPQSTRFINWNNGFQASFTGQVSGMSTNVTIFAVYRGAEGNDITLNFDGVKTINTAISEWNSSNPNNTAVITGGSNGSQIPNNGQSIALSGGSDVAGNKTGYKALVENNTINGLDNYANIGAVIYQPMGQFQGSLLGNIATSGSSPIKICSTMVSPDKSKWLVSVTNNGELEVIK